MASGRRATNLCNQILLVYNPQYAPVLQCFSPACTDPPPETARSNTSVCPHVLDSRQSLSNAKNIRLGSFYGASRIGYSLPASKSILHARFSSQQLYSVLDFKAGYCFDQPLNIVGFIICCSPGSSTIPATQSSLTCCCAYKMIDSWKHEPSRSTRRW